VKMAKTYTLIFWGQRSWLGCHVGWESRFQRHDDDDENRKKKKILTLKQIIAWTLTKLHRSAMKLFVEGFEAKRSNLLDLNDAVLRASVITELCSAFALVFGSRRIGVMAVAEPTNVNQHRAHAHSVFTKKIELFRLHFCLRWSFNKEFLLLFFFVLLFCLPLTFDTWGWICCEFFWWKKRLG